jgi:sulfide dehydrogenase cytochrome subunit
LFAVALALAGTFAHGPARADMASAAVLTNTCFSCHGTDGKSAGAMPTIAGKSVTFIKNKLMGFQSDKEPSTVMGRIAKGFTEAEIKALAEFFSGQ